jgi:CPA2 family monovalent cation:H+ antiporter-2
LTIAFIDKTTIVTATAINTKIRALRSLTLRSGSFSIAVNETEDSRLTHDAPLLATIIVALTLAFILAFVAHRLKLPPLAGYLLAGVLIGPFTPGYVADQHLANQLAELGVILLMFGVGLHFSLKDLIAVRTLALPGAVGQIAGATLLGMGLGYLMGWPWGAGIIFGLCLSVASTVVLIRALQDRRLIETERGRIAVGWLVVEDLVMVLTLVLIGPLSDALGGIHVAPTEQGVDFAVWLGISPVSSALLLTAVRVAGFVAIMLLIGRRVVPWLLHVVAHTGSRELFRLAVLAIALGVAFSAAQLFGVSFALGAFFAGMVMAESPLSQQAARETLPLRDAFSVLFFVSVGMLFDPKVLIQQPWPVLGTFLTIVVGKSVIAYGIVRMFRHPHVVALTISASLAQIGEFSFILGVLGADLKILPDTARDLIIAGAILSILLNPFLFMALDRVTREKEKVEDELQPRAAAAPESVEERPTHLHGHAILVGHGRVGSRVSSALRGAGVPLLVIEEEANLLASLRDAGVECFVGTAGEEPLLNRINLGGARWLILAIPDPFEAGRLIEAAREANPQMRIVARAQNPESVEYLKSLGADLIVFGEEETARSLFRDVIATREPDRGA